MSRKHCLGLPYYLLLAIVLVSLLTLLIPVSVVRADSVVTFPDPNLQSAMREAIGKPALDISQSDLVDLTSFGADMNSIPICTASNDQDNAELISDGSGGAIITWEDFRSSTNADIYA